MSRAVWGHVVSVFAELAGALAIDYGVDAIDSTTVGTVYGPVPRV